jgi:hypothetical protein
MSKNRFVENWVERKGTRFMVEREISRSQFFSQVVNPSDTIMKENGTTLYLADGKVLGFLPNTREERYILVIDRRLATEAVPDELPESKVEWY